MSAIMLAAICQCLVVAAACAIATRACRIPWQTVCLAALAFCWVPIGRVPGTAVDIQGCDLLGFAALGLLLTSRPARLTRLEWVALVAALLWPMLGVARGLLAGQTDLGAWAIFVGRRLTFVSVWLVGARALVPRLRTSDALDVVVLLWIGMTVVGCVQFAGLIDVDSFNARLTDADVGLLSVSEGGGRGQRGFLGLNRGAVGVVGACVLSYSVAMLAFARSPTARARRWMYIASSVLTPVALLGSGSRTGLLSALCAMCYLLLCRPARDGAMRLKVLRATVAALFAAGVVLQFVAAARAPGSSRFSRQSIEVGTSQTRFVVQQGTLRVGLADPITALIGYGPSIHLFYELVGSRYAGLDIPHNEYLEVFWQAGIPGLAAYLLLCYGIFARLRARRSGSRALAVAGRAILVGGLVSGLAVGFFFVTLHRLAPLSCLLAWAYGSLTGPIARASGSEGRGRREARSDGTAGPETPPSDGSSEGGAG